MGGISTEAWRLALFAQARRMRCQILWAHSKVKLVKVMTVLQIVKPMTLQASKVLKAMTYLMPILMYSMQLKVKVVKPSMCYSLFASVPLLETGRATIHSCGQWQPKMSPAAVLLLACWTE